MSLTKQKSQFTDRRQTGQSDGLRAGLVRATAEKKSLPLIGITVDQSLQVRVGGLDADHLDSIITKLTNGGEIDRAIVVFRTPDGKYLLADGFHRLEAYKRVGRKTVVCEVHDGDWEAARLYAETANMEHGLRINNEDKKSILESRLTRKYYENEDGILASDGVIAADLGISRPTAGMWLKAIVTSKNLLVDLSRRVDKDGRVVTVEGIQTAQQQRAVEAAERKRTLSAIGKIQALCTLFYGKYAAAKAERGIQLLDDPDKGYDWCYQFRNPTYTLGPGGDAKFQADYAALPVALYQEFLRLTDKATFGAADMDNWTDEQLAEYTYAMGQRPPRQSNVGETFERTSMAQPKHPDLPYQPPASVGRHRLTEVAAPEAKTNEHLSARDALLPEKQVQTTHDPQNNTPFVIGQRVLDIDLGHEAEIVSINGGNVTLQMEGLPEYEVWFTDLQAVEGSAVDPAEGDEASRESVKKVDPTASIPPTTAQPVESNGARDAALERKRLTEVPAWELVGKWKRSYNLQACADLLPEEQYELQRTLETVAIEAMKLWKQTTTWPGFEDTHAFPDQLIDLLVEVGYVPSQRLVDAWRERLSGTE